MQLLHTAGSSADPLTRTTFAALGLRERQHLQEWVISNPVVLGEDLLVVTAEYDSWRGSDGVASKDRLDVLAIEASGRLVVAELKRDEDRDVHLQALNYAALVSRFDLSTLAEAHSHFLTARGHSVDVEEARQRLLEHVEDFDAETLRTPRIVLVAASFPRIVTHTAVWLSEVGLDISLVQVSLWQVGPQVIGSFERLYPVPALEDFTLAPARQEAAAAKAKAVERTRRGRSLERIAASDALPVGSLLVIVPETRITPEEREAVEAWVAERPARGRARYTGEAGSELTWEADGTTWSATGLAVHIVEQAIGRRPPVLSGPRWWATESGVTIKALAESLSDARGAFDWAPLHRILDGLPPGRWTTYGDLAALIGTSPQPLGGHITNCRRCANAWRVLDRSGRVAAGFSWSDPDRADDPEDVLVAEGVSFRDGRAAPDRQLTRDELRRISGRAPEA